jgi:polyhydroxyalkanoate synthesis regulator phasin
VSTDFYKMTRRFLLGEGYDPPTVDSYIQSLEESLNSIKSRSVKENNKIKIARQHLKEIKRSVRRLNERVNVLEEQVKVLEEGKD